MSPTSFSRAGEYIFTSESVSEGHPDKVCDQISDAILDAFLKEDPESRVAVECLVTTNKVVIAGEVRGPGSVNKKRMEQVAREVIRDIGYEQEGFHWNEVDVEVLVHEQSPDIAMGVDEYNGHEQGAGDQGIMFGYAKKETDVLMPAPILYAHRVLQALSTARRQGKLPLLGPDAKSQVTLQYKNGQPLGAEGVLVSTQHKEGVTEVEIREMIYPYIVQALPKGWMCADEKFLVNPTGKFVIGGPEGDCGLTGRKIIVDTYGGAAPHGGGAFSGKDPTKVDRSAAYMARYIAKNIVAAGLAEECTIQLAYAIGVAQPVSFYINTHNTGIIGEEDLAKAIHAMVSLTPKGIRKHLQLNQPIYRPTASYGHFGREALDHGAFSWERLDLVSGLRSYFNMKALALAE